MTDEETCPVADINVDIENLKELIKMNKEWVRKYPDDFSLKSNLENLKLFLKVFYQYKLLQELQTARQADIII